MGQNNVGKKFLFLIFLYFRFEQIYVNCIIPDIAEFNTSLRNINEQIQFDESRFIITSDLPNIKVLEMLQTRRAVLKVTKFLFYLFLQF